MNYWGATPFDNEAANDWLYDFGENDFRLIDRTLAGIANLQPVDTLDEWEAAEALVAAECIAAACGYPAADLPDEIQQWLSANAPLQVKPEFVAMARQAAARTHIQSDMRDVWAATDHFDLWDTAVTDLLNRLNQITPSH